MKESQPKKRPGGHAYGRSRGPLSNTAEEGELCIYSGHGIGRFSKSSMRYDSHQACVKCVAGAREGRMSFDLNRLIKRERKRALKFWSQVDIAQPDDCWNWQGCINKRTGQPQFAWRRHGISSSTQHHPQRVAMWLTWGDLGFSGVKTTCGNKYCCNPFHLIPSNVGVFVEHESYLESFELACEIHTLKQQVAEYVMEEALKEQQLDQSDVIDAHALLAMQAGASYDDRFSAAIGELLGGHHTSLLLPDQPGLFRKPADAEAEEADEWDGSDY